MKKCSVLIFIFFVWRLAAQPEANYDLLSVNEGLSQGMVFSILESRDGFIWIATKDGLNRYDGYRFEIFSPDPFDPFAIAASEVRHLHEDKRGWIWVGYDGGLDVFMPEKRRFFHLPIPAEQGFIGYIGRIVELPGGEVWVDSNGTLWRLDAVENGLKKAAAANLAFPDFKYTKIEPPASRSATGEFMFTPVFFTKDQSLIAGSNHGIYQIDLITAKLLPPPQPKEFGVPGSFLNPLGEGK